MPMLFARLARLLVGGMLDLRGSLPPESSLVSLDNRQ